MHNGAFFYTFLKDAGRTGNLEINIRSKDASEEDKKLVHSKSVNK